MCGRKVKTLIIPPPLFTYNYYVSEGDGSPPLQSENQQKLKIMSYNRGKNWKKKQSKKSSSSLMEGFEGFGMFYKDNEESGFCFDVNKFQSSEIVDDLIFMYQRLEKLYELDSDWIKKGKVSKEELIDGRTNELKQSINDWNSYQNITKRNGTFYDLVWDYGDRNFLDMVSIIMYGILFLMKMGEIKNDNYNGFKFTNKYQMVS